MNLPVAKKRVRESFDRAAQSYDSAAIVQRRVCQRLLEELAWEKEDPTRILDAGAGTGYAINLLKERWPKSDVFASDLAFSMLKQIQQPDIPRFAADMEKLPLAPQSLDLWWSNLSIQWCTPNKVFKEAAQVLKPGGMVAFSTLSTGTFSELREAFKHIDAYQHTIPFNTIERLQESLVKAGFHNIILIRERHAVYYPNLKALLKSVKAIGANNVGKNKRTGMMGKDAWKKIEAAYEEYREKEGLPASYDVILGYAKQGVPHYEF